VIFFLSSLYGNALYNKGEYLYFSKACSSCHGPSAEGGSSSPKLANKSQKYLTAKLYIYKKGEITTQSGEMMSQFIRVLSDKDIEALSVFLSKHKKHDIEDVSDDVLGGFGS
jgi:cytochrome c553